MRDPCNKLQSDRATRVLAPPPIDQPSGQLQSRRGAGLLDLGHRCVLSPAAWRDLSPREAQVLLRPLWSCGGLCGTLLALHMPPEAAGSEGSGPASASAAPASPAAATPDGRFLPACLCCRRRPQDQGRPLDGLSLLPRVAGLHQRMGGGQQSARVLPSHPRPGGAPAAQHCLLSSLHPPPHHLCLPGQAPGGTPG